MKNERKTFRYSINIEKKKSYNLRVFFFLIFIVKTSTGTWSRARVLQFRFHGEYIKRESGMFFSVFFCLSLFIKIWPHRFRESSFTCI